jgi:UDP-glucose 4-epimerase
MAHSPNATPATVLITGGSGFIGSHIAAWWLARGAEVRVLDNLRTGYRSNLAGMGVEFTEASILDRPALRQAMQGVDYVFHLAAMVSVPESMADPHGCVSLNVSGLLNVLEEASGAGVKRLVHSSSAAVYGESPEIPKREEMAPDPRSPYAVTKLDGEYYAALFARTGKLETVSLRYFNVFGPRQDPRSTYAAAVPIFVANALANRPLVIHGDGGQTRDFVFVADVAAANGLAATHPDARGTYNVGYGSSLSIRRLAELIIELTGSSSEIIHGPDRPGDVRHSVASADRIRSLGLQSAADFRGGLARTIEYFRGRMTG